MNHRGAELLCECLGNLHGLANACAFDNDVLDLFLGGQARELGEKITPECATDAAILELDQGLFGVGDGVVFDKGGVDVEAAWISR